jgi:hypothetical protein
MAQNWEKYLLFPPQRVGKGNWFLCKNDRSNIKNFILNVKKQNSFRPQAIEMALTEQSYVQRWNCTGNVLYSQKSQNGLKTSVLAMKLWHY